MIRNSFHNRSISLRKTMLVILLLVSLLPERYVCFSTSGQTNLTVDVAHLNGSVLLQFGKTINNIILKMIGNAMVNLEHNQEDGLKTLQSGFNNIEQNLDAKINSIEHNMESNFDNITQNLEAKMCDLKGPCSDWTRWGNCTGKYRNTYGTQDRHRECWYTGTSACAKDGDKTTENESRLCEGGEYCPPKYNISSHGFCLKYSATTETREEAEKICQHDGGHLINVDSEERWADVIAIVTAEGKKKFWIDGMRSIQAGPWSYSSGHDPASVGLDHWGRGEPSNGITELCKVAEYSSKFMWWDRVCTDSYIFVCEIRE